MHKSGQRGLMVFSLILLDTETNFYCFVLNGERAMSSKNRTTKEYVGKSETGK
jgi:hypothetical protein